MSFTKILVHFWISVIVLVCLTPAYAQTQTLQADDPMLKKCGQEWWCNEAAQPPSPWPAPYSGKTVEIAESPRLLIKIPADPKRIVHSDYILLVAYEDNRVLVFEVSSEDLFQRLFPPLMKDVHLTMLDIANTIFTKTSKDKEPEIIPDLMLWRFAINMKCLFFKEKTTIFSSRKGPVTCYYWQAPGGESTAIFVNADNPDAFLKIIGKGMSFDTFKGVVGAIREKNK